MVRVVRLVLSLGLLSSFSLVSGGCSTSGVGDPCVPEQIPEGGFKQEEAYVEASSVQCRTRACIVTSLEGDPRNVFYSAGDPRNTCTLGDADCHTNEEIENSVYCSCRCRAPAGSDTPTCECPDGFECQDLLELGGVGIRGGYCVKSEPTPIPADGG